MPKAFSEVPKRIRSAGRREISRLSNERMEMVACLRDLKDENRFLTRESSFYDRLLDEYRGEGVPYSSLMREQHEETKSTRSALRRLKRDLQEEQAHRDAVHAQLRTCKAQIDHCRMLLRAEEEVGSVEELGDRLEACRQSADLKEQQVQMCRLRVSELREHQERERSKEDSKTKLLQGKLEQELDRLTYLKQMLRAKRNEKQERTRNLSQPRQNPNKSRIDQSPNHLQANGSKELFSPNARHQLISPSIDISYNSPQTSMNMFDDMTSDLGKSLANVDSPGSMEDPQRSELKWSHLGSELRLLRSDSSERVDVSGIGTADMGKTNSTTPESTSEGDPSTSGHTLASSSATNSMVGDFGRLSVSKAASSSSSTKISATLPKSPRRLKQHKCEARPAGRLGAARQKPLRFGCRGDALDPVKSRPRKVYVLDPEHLQNGRPPRVRITGPKK